MTVNDWSAIFAGVASFLGALGGVASLSYWLATRFNRVYERLAAVEKLILLKIEDHEKLDVTRFASVEMAIMKLEMRMPTGLERKTAP